MKIFAKDEISGILEEGQNPLAILNTDILLGMFVSYILKIDVTVDQCRQIMGIKPHPDPSKGSKFIWEEEEGN